MTEVKIEALKFVKIIRRFMCDPNDEESRQKKGLMYAASCMQLGNTRIYSKSTN